MRYKIAHIIAELLTLCAGDVTNLTIKVKSERSSEAVSNFKAKGYVKVHSYLSDDEKHTYLEFNKK